MEVESEGLIRFKLKEYTEEKNKLSNTTRKQLDTFRIWDLKKTGLSRKSMARKNEGAARLRK